MATKKAAGPHSRTTTAHCSRRRCTEEKTGHVCTRATLNRSRPTRPSRKRGVCITPVIFRARMRRGSCRALMATTPPTRLPASTTTISKPATPRSRRRTKKSPPGAKSCRPQKKNANAYYLAAYALGRMAS